MYDPFCVCTIDTDFSDNTITITCNKIVDADSVNENTVFVYRHSGKRFSNISYSIDETRIIVKIKDSIVPNEEYLISISNIKTMLGEELPSGVVRSIKFESAVTEIPTIISPGQFEDVETMTVKLSPTIKLSSEEDTAAGTPAYQATQVYRIQICRNILFSDMDLLVNSIVAEKHEATFSPVDSDGNPVIKDGMQYYVRARIENIDHEGIYYGQWSEPVSFTKIAKKQEQEEDPDDEPIYIPSLRITKRPENNITSDKIVIEFNQPISPDFLSNILVTRSDI